MISLLFLKKFLMTTSLPRFGMVVIIGGEVIDESTQDGVLKLKKAVIAKLKPCVLINDDGPLDIERVVMEKFNVQDCIHIIKSKSMSCESSDHLFKICDIVIQTAIHEKKQEPQISNSNPMITSYKMKVMNLFKGVSSSGKILKNISGSEIIQRLATEEECKLIYGENGKKNFCGSDNKGTTINGIFYSMARLIQAFPEKLTVHYQALVKYSTKNEIYCDEKKIDLTDFIHNLSIQDVEKLLAWKGDLCACQTNIYPVFAFVIGNIGFKIENLANNILHLPFNSTFRFGLWSCNQHQNNHDQHQKEHVCFVGNFYCHQKFDMESIWCTTSVGKISFELIAKKFGIKNNDGEKTMILKGLDDKENSFLQMGSIVVDFNSLSEFVVQ